MENTVLENLNPAQKEAVLSTDGPMLIIAGAGTGKTRVITGRILHLLLEKKVPSSQILALTFTEKATEEMVSRIDAAMPLSYEELAIHTFHGFCDRILKEKGHEIGLDPGFRLLDRTEQWIFLKKHLFELELEYYRPLGNPNKFIFVLLEHFSRLKDEDVAPDAYLGFAEKKLAAATDEAEQEEARKMLEVARAYGACQRLLVEENVLDFGDLQYFALRLLEKRQSVLREYRERYRYILVDEFQDTNFAQNKLVNLLAGGHRNLTVVGDDDQSIYKWRGASLSNILKFRQNFPDARAVLLTSNYRSSQNILDTSYKLIRHNDPYRLEVKENVDKRLRGGAGEGEPVEIRHFAGYVAEARQTAGDISSLVKSGARFKDCAILVRANQHAGAFAQALKEAGIPYAMRDAAGLTRYEEIKDLLALLRFLTRPGDDIAFFRLLNLPLLGLSAEKVYELASQARDESHKQIFYHLRDLLGRDGGQVELPGMSAPDEGMVKLARAYDLFNGLLDFTRGHTASRVMGEFMDRSGYYKSLTGELEGENAEKVLHISQFMEMAREFESEGGEGLHSLLEYLKVIEEAQGSLAVKVVADEDAVSILTVHSSKGLEFDFVFVPCLAANRFPATRRGDPLPIPPELAGDDLPGEDMHLQEERRLFYVACTRARRKLYLSWSDFYEGPKKWKPSVFLKDIAGENVVERDFTSVNDMAADGEKPDLSDGPAPEGRKQTGKERKHSGLKKPPYSAHVEKLLFVPQVDVNSLSYSKIDTFRTCPLKYKFRYLFELQAPSPHAANFGSSVHETVNAFYTALKEGQKATPGLMAQCYEQSWIGKGYDSLAHEQTRKKKGREMMERFYLEEEKNGFKIPEMLEKAFSLKIGGMRFHGRIDRIDRLADGTYEVIDFKTGTYKKGADVGKDLQLSLYAMACKEVFMIPVSRLSLYFLEDLKKVSTTRDEKDLLMLKEEMTEACGEMMQSAYLPTPGHHCQWCEYRVLCSAAV